MSNQCDHGHLRRVCEICQRDEEIERLKAERDAAVAVLETVLRIPSMSDADLEQLQINCKAAIDAARSKT